jgi:hypothetical protein
MNTVHVDVISPLPEGWGICLSCEMLMARANLDQAPHQRGLDEYPPEWQEEFQHLSNVVLELSTRYQDNIFIQIWDPRSLQGLMKSIRYWVRRYPTFIVNGQNKVTGWDVRQLSNILSPLVAFHKLKKLKAEEIFEHRIETFPVG